MSKKIKTISFLVGDKRVFIHSTKFGKFKIPFVEVVNGSMKTIEKMVYPKEVVLNENVKNRDPTLTLETGEKVRVYQGGDPTYMLVRASCLLDAHKENQEKINSENLEKYRSKQERKNNDDIFNDLGDWY